MSMIDEIRSKAKRNVKTIVLPEGDEERTLLAAAKMQQESIVRPILLGDPDRILSAAKIAGAKINDVPVIDPTHSPQAEAYANMLYELRKEKGVTKAQAKALVQDPMYYGMMMVKEGAADGLVSGAEHTTGDMLRPALQIIKTAPGVKVVSSAYLMEFSNRQIGENGLLLFSDCVVLPCPTAEELAHIAISTAGTAKTLCDIPVPRVALLSFSTKGSAKHALVTKVQEAAKIAQALAPDLVLDGELQFDAAMVPSVAASKAPDSPVAGRANVLIFPDLQAANIGYKIAQRLTGADGCAVLQGLSKPCNDLSRGCTVDELINTVAITAVQAQVGPA